MKKQKTTIKPLALGSVALLTAFLFGASPAASAPDIPGDFDNQGGKVFNRYNETPLAALTGTDGRRTLASYYELRQYPGSPPIIPHEVSASLSEEGKNETCIACHGRGGYDQVQKAFAPLTPHPENELCYQCHVPRTTSPLFVESDWQSIPPPRLGRSALGGSPPPPPHALQMREDCLACHAGPAAVAEIRVEHASRGNCRQCHVPLVATAPVTFFQRTE